MACMSDVVVLRHPEPGAVAVRIHFVYLQDIENVADKSRRIHVGPILSPDG